LKEINHSSLGDVILVRKISDHRFYAIKCIPKEPATYWTSQPEKHYAFARAERDVMAESDGKWLVKLRAAFQDAHRLYLVMDYFPGGDLGKLLENHKQLSERVAAFYAAEITLGLEALHKMGYMHRDLKPDNVLIAADGHVKIADFGFAKSQRAIHNKKYYCELLRRACLGKGTKFPEPPKPKPRIVNGDFHASSRLGTPGFIAPEVLRQQPYSFEVD
jgi:protein-serine/threonine kinase